MNLSDYCFQRKEDFGVFDFDLLKYVSSLRLKVRTTTHPVSPSSDSINSVIVTFGLYNSLTLTV